MSATVGTLGAERNTRTDGLARRFVAVAAAIALAVAVALSLLALRSSSPAGTSNHPAPVVRIAPANPAYAHPGTGTNGNAPVKVGDHYCFQCRS
ncbi:MAG TPA: hypothetical protein DIT48_08540 [Actinobacteria bacterium]|jgi:hypothetical protein|nr:hypothetical protein [Actinomycetota bacterium]